MSEYISLYYSDLKDVFKIISDGEMVRYNKHLKKWIPLEFEKTFKNYPKTRFYGTKIPVHRIAWVLYHKKDLTGRNVIDHLNGDIYNFTKSNLRLATVRENEQNRHTHRNGKLVGATYSKRDKSWFSRIVINKEIVHLGTFQTEREAHDIYMTAYKSLNEFVDRYSFRDLVTNKLYGQEVAV